MSFRLRSSGRSTWRWERLVVLLALVALGGCAVLDTQQRRWIFQPSQATWSGGAAAAEGLADVWLDFESRLSERPVRLHALWLPHERSDAPVLLFLHGARWDVRGSAFRMRRLNELGFSVLGVDYRGFGQSTDELPSEESALEDARAAWDWLRREHPQRRHFIYGHSLGGAIAVRLAAEVGSTSGGLIVEATFTSIPDVYRTLRYGWLPLTPFITQRFDAASRIGQVASPVLVVHGSADGLIRPELGQALYERAPSPKRFVLVPGGSHHNAQRVGREQVQAALIELFGVRP
ncbi:MAG: alpha/beta hydrolase [Rubrivivax sp.]|nr:alpha/beta hydrolase [Rubrivivax sp.]